MTVRRLGTASTVLVFIVAILAGRVASSSGSSVAPGTGGRTMPQQSSVAVTVAMMDIRYDQREIRIPANTDVTVILPNEGVTPHNFAIDALGISVDIAPGTTEEVVINAPPGTYEFYCNVPGHKEAGMVVTVESELAV